MAKLILVVDDSKSMRMLVSKLLRDIGFDTIDAEDGVDGLKKLGKNKVDAVISDVNMPGMDGITFVKKIKSHEQFKFLPVMMLTTEAQKELILEVRKIGVSGWLVKPFTHEKLQQAICRIIKP